MYYWIIMQYNKIIQAYTKVLKYMRKHNSFIAIKKSNVCTSFLNTLDYKTFNYS